MKIFVFFLSLLAHTQKNNILTQYNYDDDHPEYEKLKLEFLNSKKPDSARPMSVEEIKQNLTQLKQSEFRGFKMFADVCRGMSNI